MKMNQDGGAIIVRPLDYRESPDSTIMRRMVGWIAEKYGYVWPTMAELELRKFELSLTRLITNTMSGEG